MWPEKYITAELFKTFVSELWATLVLQKFPISLSKYWKQFHNVSDNKFSTIVEVICSKNLTQSSDPNLTYIAGQILEKFSS